MRRKPLASIVFLGLLTASVGAYADGPVWRSLVPFRQRVEADPAQSYALTDAQGPWMVLAATFSGEGAEAQAHELVISLRRDHNLPAYLYSQTFDFTEPVRGIGVDRYNRPRQMQYRQNLRFDEIAVLVGDYESPESERIQETLDAVRHLHPDCLNFRARQKTTQRFVGLRDLHRRIVGGERRERGPMGSAFISRNPLIPAEYFRQTGVDDLVIRINRGVRHSLMNNPEQYTVQIATFRGYSTMNITEMETFDPRQQSQLEEAADKAHRLTMALREQGVEAYEFHDRHESIVTVGGFPSVGTPRGDGKIEINPAVHAVIEQFRARRQDLGNVDGLQPVVINGVHCDVQPMPIMVPRPENRGGLFQ